MVSIQESERKLAEKKRQLENFQPEFCDIKKKYEEACKKLEEDITETIGKKHAFKKYDHFHKKFAKKKNCYEIRHLKKQLVVRDRILLQIFVFLALETMQARDTAYTDYIDQSGMKYSHVPPTRQQMNQQGGAGLLGGIGKLFG